MGGAVLQQMRMIDLMQELFPICRSITGNGLRQTFEIIKKIIPITIYEVPSGTKVFDWTIPREWNVREAFVEDMSGKRVIDFAENNLHLLGYSVPVDAVFSLETLQNHLYSLPDQPTAIPYITSYYSERWGFCLEHARRQALTAGEYRVRIDSDLSEGSLTYADLVIPGETEEEIFFSTYVCHPSMANDELSGPVVATFLAQKIMALPRRKYTYRFVFAPETIGALTYLSRHLGHLRAHTKAGFNLSCIGDDRAWSYVASPRADSYADKIMANALRFVEGPVHAYSFLERASDERQYCAPGVDLPLVTVCRSRFGMYPEYHTSLDNFDLVSEKALNESLSLLLDCCRAIEENCRPRACVIGEPQLGKRGLYATLSQVGSSNPSAILVDILAYADGTRDVFDLSTLLNLPTATIVQHLNILRREKLVE